MRGVFRNNNKKKKEKSKIRICEYNGVPRVYARYGDRNEEILHEFYVLDVYVCQEVCGCPFLSGLLSGGEDEVVGSELKLSCKGDILSRACFIVATWPMTRVCIL